MNNQQPTARERLITAMRNRTCFCGADSCQNPEPLVDAVAHELAEQIRTTDLPEIHVDMFDNGTQWAADLIDPEVSSDG